MTKREDDSMADRNEQVWAPDDSSPLGFDVVRFEVRDGAVTVWAGDELDPASLTPQAARQAAREWPVILVRLADAAEAAR